MAPSLPKTDGRRTAATPRSRSLWRSRRCSPPPTSPTPRGHSRAASYLRETADIWNDSIERWTYVTGYDAGANARSGRLLRAHRAAQRAMREPALRPDCVSIKNHPPGGESMAYDDLVSPDALALVRFGLQRGGRSANREYRARDRLRCCAPRRRRARHGIDTTTTATANTRTDRRSTGQGIGRGWPLLAGERGALRARRRPHREARLLLEVMRRQTSVRRPDSRAGLGRGGYSRA